MPLRLSGLVSGMDTDTIIKELMKAQRTKSTKLENKITKLEWTQDKWKDLNKKIYSLYTGSLSKLRLQGSYGTKKAATSNADKVTVTAGTTTPVGTHNIQVKQLASSQFITGAQCATDKNGKAITLGTKLSDLNFDTSEGTTVMVKTAAGKETTFDIGSSTTVGDFINGLKKAGLDASYDTNQKRFFISSKNSGLESAFSITTSSSEYGQDRNAIRDFMDYGNLSSSDREKIDNALQAYLNDTNTADDFAAIKNTLLTITHNNVKTAYMNDYISNPDNITAATESERARLEAELPEGETLNEDTLKAAVKVKLQKDAEAATTAEHDAWADGTAADTNVFKQAETELDALLATYKTDSGTAVTQTNSLSNLGLSEITYTKTGDSVTVSADSSVTCINPTDSVIVYNGVELTNSSNNVSVNGLTLTLMGVTNGSDGVAGTADDETISLTVSNDSQAVYDMIKDFVKTYNELLTEMNDAYDAPSARGFEPLTDEEKDSMSETQIDKWESKIKTALLRRDTTLSSLINSMRTNLIGSVEVDGKKYSLASFGIGSANYTENGLLHIDGDKDDSMVSDKENKLMEALNDDPDKVMQVLSGLAGDLYKSMQEKMSSSSLKSALTFYNDKEIAKEITDYQSDLKTLEAKLQDMEDKYYKQFAAMETAMSKANSQSSALASMLGTKTQ